MPQDSEITANAANELARAYSERGQLALASLYFEQTLACRESSLGLDHNRSLSAMSNLAQVLADLEKHAEALEYFEVVRTIRSQTKNEDNPSVLAIDLKIALMHRRQGKLQEALGEYKTVLAKYNASLHSNHPSVLAVMFDVAETCRMDGRQAEAMGIYRDLRKKYATSSAVPQSRAREVEEIIAETETAGPGNTQGDSMILPTLRALCNHVTDCSMQISLHATVAASSGTILPSPRENELLERTIRKHLLCSQSLQTSITASDSILRP